MQSVSRTPNVPGSAIHPLLCSLPGPVFSPSCGVWVAASVLRREEWFWSVPRGIAMASASRELRGY